MRTPIGEGGSERPWPPSVRLLDQWRLRKYCLSLIALALMGINRPAFAQNVTVQISGTLSSGTDYLGLFGPAGADLTNQLFVTSFTYNPDDFAAGGESCNNSYITNAVGALTTSLTINGHTYSYANTNNASSCSNGNPFGATLSFVSGGNTISNSSPFGNLYQSFFLTYETTQLGSLDSPGSPAQGAFAVFAIVQGSDTSSDNLAGSVGPTILFNGTPVSSLPNPIPVVVGQPISLTGQPASQEQQPWTPGGSPIGGYTIGPDCPKPKKGKINVGAPTVQCSAKIDPVKKNGQNIKFYWTVPTATGAIYAVNYTANGGTASAAFSVAGPTGPNITLQDTTGNVVTYVDFTRDGKRLACSIQPCIIFAPSATLPQNSGDFEWVQILSVDTIMEAGSDACNYSVTDPALDNSYPYPFNDELGSKETDDSPYVILKGLTSVSRNFDATMYLMWKAKVGGSIPVALGYVQWGFNASAILTNGKWKPTSGPLTVIQAFTPTSMNPTWSNVSLGCPNN